MANPVLQRTFGAAPDSAVAEAQRQGGVSVGPVSADTMSIQGVFRSGLVFFALLLAGAVYGWGAIGTTTAFPGWFLWALLGLVGVAIAIAVRPALAPILGPVYALAQGVLLGVISGVYEAAFEGIVLNAVLATLITFLGMLILYGTGIIKVTERFRKVLIGATIGVFGFYLVSIVLSLFGVPLTFAWDAGPLGIGISLVVIVIAALNLALDFDFIDRGVAARLPSRMDWLAAFGLMVTLVWLYLEFLRLFARLNQR